MRVFSARAGDATTALQKCLDEGPGHVQLGHGEFRCAGLRIPPGVTLAGEGPATVLRLGTGDSIIRQDNAGDWRVRDLVLEGGAEGEWTARADRGRCGIRVQGCWGYEIAGVVVRSVDGAGVWIGGTALGAAAPWCNGGNLDRLTVHNCETGIRFEERAEYINAVAISAYHNVTGVVLHGGNLKLSASNICSNVDGVFIEDKDNGSHGALGNCLVNHNQRHALWCRNVKNGMTVQNCCFFYGDIAIEDSQGVVISGGEICCNLRVRGEGVNRIAGNYVIPYPGICERFEFSPLTRLEGNFAPQGSWPAGNGAR